MGSKIQPIPTEQVGRLIQAVEQTFGRTPKTPKDFNLLRLSVFEHTSVLLSATTLKRLWGYLDEKVEPRRYTLDTLCRYAGWPDLNTMNIANPTPESGPLAIERIDIADGELHPGDKLTITWLPDRKIVVEYLGAGFFRIISALNTRLQVGDTFTTGMIIMDHPLYLDRLTRNNVNLGAYVCGRNSGIRFIVETIVETALNNIKNFDV